MSEHNVNSMGTYSYSNTNNEGSAKDQMGVKNRFLALVGTFFIPGFAHIYCDRLKEGIVLLLIVMWGYILPISGFNFGFFLHLIAIITAEQVVKGYNLEVMRRRQYSLA